VFILIEGKAFLIIEGEKDGGEHFDTIDMNTNIVYNVKKGKWHHIVMERDSSVIIVENSDTDLENTEYKPIDESEINRIKSIISSVRI
jgi:ureidoglycolate hydrolase